MYAMFHPYLQEKYIHVNLRIINNDKSKRFAIHAYHIHRSKQINNSSGLEVETKFFGLNKLHTCSPNRHASKILSLSRFNLGSQIIKTFITSLLSVFILACPSLLCQKPTIIHIISTQAWFIMNVNIIHILMPFSYTYDFVGTWINDMECMSIKAYFKTISCNWLILNTIMHKIFTI